MRWKAWLRDGPPLRPGEPVPWYRAQAARRSPGLSEVSRGLRKLAIVCGVLFVGAVSWTWLNDAGYIYHDILTIVYSPDWQVGEYKTCTSVNGALVSNVLCDGGVPSGRVEDGKRFNIRFHGRTFDKFEPDLSKPDVAPAVFVWKCRKNQTDDPSITCWRVSEEVQREPQP